jgi:hypothetical protein
MKRIGVGATCILMLVGLALPACAAEIRTTKDAITACAVPIHGPDGNQRPDFKKLESEEQQVLIDRDFACSEWISENEVKYCSGLEPDVFRTALLNAARSPALAKLPVEKFVQNVAVMVPGCSLRTCPSDHIIYRSEDGKGEFAVSETARGRKTTHFSTGKITFEITVLKGRVGDKALYMHELDVVENTSEERTGTRPPPLVSEKVEEGWKLKWGSWPVKFRSGAEAFYLHEDGMKGLWTYSECRGGAQCPAGWSGSCDGPPTTPKADQTTSRRSSSDPFP